jgi:Leucine Rich repeat
MRQLTHLAVIGYGEGIGDELLRIVAPGRAFRNLTSLEVFDRSVTEVGVRALAETSELHVLENLGFAYHPKLGPEGAEALVLTQHLSKLSRLDLWGCNVGDRGIAALVSGALAEVRTLQMFGNDVGVGGAEAIATSAHLRELRHLDLSANKIGDGGLCAIARSDRMPQLEVLFIGGNEFGPAGVCALAESPHFPHLTALNLGGTPGGVQIGDSEVETLASSAHLTGLKELLLYDNDIGPRGAAAIASNAGFRDLTMLDLENTNIGDEGAAALASSPHMGALTTLDLRNNGIGPAAEKKLRRLPRLTKLRL